VRANNSSSFDIPRLRGRPISEALDTPIEPGDTSKTPLGRLFGNETKVYGALTFGDLAYDWIRINPHVIEALDFVRVADLADIYAFARCADSIQALGDAARLGKLTQMQGYVAERIAAGMLRAQGAEVELPASSSHPGYDLIVNGQHWQVKCLDAPGGVYEHLGRYPDIPVMVNEELAQHFIYDDRVMALPGLQREEVRQATEDSLEAGADLIDLEIPIISTTMQAARNALAFVKGHTDWCAAVQNLGIDSVARIAGGKAGAIATAASLGLIGVTGGWFAVVAPALGALGGYAWGRHVADRTKMLLFCQKEIDALADALRAYLTGAIEVLRGMIARGEHQAWKLGAKRNTSSAAGLELIDDYQGRVKDERNFRMAMIREFESLIKRLDSWSAFGPHLIAMTEKASLNAAQAGLLPADLASETRRLAHTMAALQNALRRRLVRA